VASSVFRPSALAVFKLMASSTLVACCTGRSAGFSSFRMRPTEDAPWLSQVRSVAHETARLDSLMETIDRGYGMAGGQCDDLMSLIKKLHPGSPIALQESAPRSPPPFFRLRLSDRRDLRGWVLGDPYFARRSIGPWANRSLLNVTRAVPPATCETAALPHPLRHLQ
jgi:hypothetical protein